MSDKDPTKKNPGPSTNQPDPLGTEHGPATKKPGK